MRQLEPGDKGSCIYKTEFMQFHGVLNCYLKLNRMHCFNKNKTYGKIIKLCVMNE